MKTDLSLRSLPTLWTAALLVLATAVPLASAGELGDTMFVSGFVSQGYLNTSENDYFMSRSVNGTAAFTEAAVTLTARPMDRLRVGIQFLGRNFGTLGGDQVSIDWAYGDYRIKDQLGIRAGKVKLPFGLYNEGRDVDMLRTSIFLPQSIYNEKMRDFILAYEGLGAYGNFDLHSGGDLDYHVFGGTLNIPDASKGIWEESLANTGRNLEPYAAMMFDDENGFPEETSTAIFSAMTDNEVTFPWVYGGALNWYTPLEGLKLGTSGMFGRYHIQSTFRYDVTYPVGDELEGYSPYYMEIDETAKIDHFAVFSAEFLYRDWNFASEYYHDSVNSNVTIGWYVLAGYRLSRWLSLGSYYSYSDPLGGQEEQEALELAGLPDYYGWQKDLTISARFDLTDFWLFKLEYHFIDGVALTEDRSLAENLEDPKARHWGMFAAKTTFHF